jgi:hypothetical protein
MKSTYVNVAAHSGAVTASLERRVEPAPARPDDPAPGTDFDPAICNLVANALNVKGRVSYTLTVEDGRLVQIAQVGIVAASGAEAPKHLTIKQAAERMHHSYDWLSRNHKRLGLHPTSFGFPLLFEAQEIDDCMKRHVKNYRGRPRKSRRAGDKQEGNR